MEAQNLTDSKKHERDARVKMHHAIVAILLLGFISTCTKQREQSGNVESVAINTPGVLCGSCAKNIEKALARLDGIEKVSVDIDKKIVQVRFVPERTSLQEIESSIASVGYDANNTKRNAEAYENLDACCKVDG